MPRKLTVIPEQCAGCRICELVCAMYHFGVNNPKKAAIRVINTYPHPVMRMPVVCSQCKKPACAAVCPVGALSRVDGVVKLDKDLCISCFSCVEACPFQARVMNYDTRVADVDYALCQGCGVCAMVCPNKATLQKSLEHGQFLAMIDAALL